MVAVVVVGCSAALTAVSTPPARGQHAISTRPACTAHLLGDEGPVAGQHLMSTREVNRHADEVR